MYCKQDIPPQGTVVKTLKPGETFERTIRRVQVDENDIVTVNLNLNVIFEFVAGTKEIQWEVIRDPKDEKQRESITNGPQVLFRFPISTAAAAVVTSAPFEFNEAGSVCDKKVTKGKHVYTLKLKNTGTDKVSIDFITFSVLPTSAKPCKDLCRHGSLVCNENIPFLSSNKDVATVTPGTCFIFDVSDVAVGREEAVVLFANLNLVFSSAAAVNVEFDVLRDRCTSLVANGQTFFKRPAPSATAGAPLTDIEFNYAVGICDKDVEPGKHSYTLLLNNVGAEQVAIDFITLQALVAANGHKVRENSVDSNLALVPCPVQYCKQLTPPLGELVTKLQPNEVLILDVRKVKVSAHQITTLELAVNVVLQTVTRAFEVQAEILRDDSVPVSHGPQILQRTPGIAAGQEDNVVLNLCDHTVEPGEHKYTAIIRNTSEVAVGIDYTSFEVLAIKGSRPKRSK